MLTTDSWLLWHEHFQIRQWNVAECHMQTTAIAVEGVAASTTVLEPWLEQLHFTISVSGP